MSFANQNCRWVYAPNGATTVFAYDNKVLTAGELVASWYDSNGNTLVLPGYVVTGVGNDNGGTVVFNAAPAAVANSQIVIERKTAAVQAGTFADYIQDDAPTRQQRFERSMALGQETRQALKRALMTLSPIDGDGPLVLPPAALRANRALLFDAMGLPTVGNPLAPGALVVSGFFQTLLGAVDQATLLGLLSAAGLNLNNVLAGANSVTGSLTVPDQAGGTNNGLAANTKFVTAAVGAAVGLTRSGLAGLKLSTAGGSSVVAIAAGAATDKTNAAVMALAASLSKTTAAWAVGNNQGGLDTGAIANNTWYHVHLIKRVDTGVVDALFSLDPAAPTMPAPYTLNRRIGSVLTDGAAHWVLFVQDGDYFSWAAPPIDVNAFQLATALANLHTLSVPLGVRVQARVAVGLMAGNGYGAGLVYISDPSTTDLAVSGGPAGGNPSTAPLYTTGSQNSAGGNSPIAHLDVFTNTASKIRSRSQNGNGADYLHILTKGWIDRRGRDD